MRSSRSLVPVALLAAALAAQKPESLPTPGMIWEKDLAAAHAASAKDKKPIVAYFTFET